VAVAVPRYRVGGSANGHLGWHLALRKYRHSSLRITSFKIADHYLACPVEDRLTGKAKIEGCGHAW